MRIPKFTHGYALIIGIANYQKVRTLPASILQDARTMKMFLQDQRYCGYIHEHVHLLLDQEASRQGILEGLTWLAKSTGTEDTAIIFFSGHGGRIEQENETRNFLISYDSDAKDLDNTAINATELTAVLRTIRARRLLVFFDCCYAGGTGQTKGLGSEISEFKTGLDEDYYQVLGQGEGRVIIASSRSDEESLVLNGWQHSLFTHYLLAALRGEGYARGDGFIRVFDVFDYVSEKVPQHGSQHPLFKGDLENNFVVALHQGGAKSTTFEAQPRKTLIDKRLLREAMVNTLNLDDLELLCASIEQSLSNDGKNEQVNLEMVGGSQSKPIKVLQLIEYLDRRGYLAYLVSEFRRHRPGIL